MNDKISRNITVPDILSRKNSNDKITVITAYDYTFARLFDQSGIEVILVGDSLSSVIQGHNNTLPVTLDEIIYHSRCVSRGASHALVVADMPFGSYQADSNKALEAAGRIIKEGGVSAVKLEGGLAVAEIISKITSFDIPVMGHVGLTPQSFHRMGGHKVQGKAHDAVGLHPGTYERILEDALAVEGAGAFAVVIECVPEDLSKEITSKLSIPTIGIGAGKYCDGQVLVMHDLLGLEDRKKPKFVKQYANLSEEVKKAAESYIREVKEVLYPAPEHSFYNDSRSKEKKKAKLQLL